MVLVLITRAFYRAVVHWQSAADFEWRGSALGCNRREIGFVREYEACCMGAGKLTWACPWIRRMECDRGRLLNDEVRFMEPIAGLAFCALFGDAVS